MRRRATTAAPSAPAGRELRRRHGADCRGAITFDPLISNGEQQTIDWHYNPAAADLDWLRAGDTLTITYVAQVNDGHGNVGAQNLVITITGTNDVPMIDAATNPVPPSLKLRATARRRTFRSRTAPSPSPTRISATR